MEALNYRLFRFDRASYHRMGGSGIIKPDVRVELVDGRICEMAPIGGEHASRVTQLIELFAPLLPKAVLWVQNPIALSDYNEPQPDFALIDRQMYRHGQLPGPQAIHLLVEVACSSLAFDRTEKARIYAEAAIPEYWVLDLASRQLLLFTEPGAEGYASCQTLSPGETLSPSAFPQFSIQVGDLLNGSTRETV